MKDLVSIVVAIYNIDAFIDKCIVSIIGQTYGYLEIILIDDGSTDKSGAICDDYAKRDSRIIVIHQQNQGLSSSRNNGITVAKGKYITFIDGDDVIRADYVEKLYTAIILGDFDMAISGYQQIDEQGNPGWIPCLGSFSADNETDIYRLFLNQKLHTQAWAKLLHRDFIIRHHLYFNDGLTIEDVPWLFHVLLFTKKIIAITDPLYYYRQRSSSIMHTLTEKNAEHVYLNTKICFSNIQEAHKTKNPHVIRMYEFFKNVTLRYYLCCSKNENTKYQVYCNLRKNYSFKATILKSIFIPELLFRKSTAGLLHYLLPYKAGFKLQLFLLLHSR